MIFQDIFEKLEPVPYLSISGNCLLKEASERVIQSPEVRGIYVIDSSQRLQGYLSLGVLIRHIVTDLNRPQFHVRSLLTTITAEKVTDIMERHVISAQPTDTLSYILDKMLMRNIKQVPIVNVNQQIITVAGILDIWKWMQ